MTGEIIKPYPTATWAIPSPEIVKPEVLLCPEHKEGIADSTRVRIERAMAVIPDHLSPADVANLAMSMCLQSREIERPIK